MTLIPSTVTISIQDRPSPQGPSIAVSISPDPSSTKRDATSPAVALWLLIRGFIQTLNKESHAKADQSLPGKSRRKSGGSKGAAKQRPPHRAAPKRRAR